MDEKRARSRSPAGHTKNHDDDDERADQKRSSARARNEATRRRRARSIISRKRRRRNKQAKQSNKQSKGKFATTTHKPTERDERHERERKKRGAERGEFGLCLCVSVLVHLCVCVCDFLVSHQRSEVKKRNFETNFRIVLKREGERKKRSFLCVHTGHKKREKRNQKIDDATRLLARARS